MASNNQPSTTSGLPNYIFGVGIIGFLMMIIPVAFKIKSPETSELVSVFGEILFFVGYAVALYLTAKKIKSENLGRPSVVIINICIALCSLTAIADLFTFGQEDSELGFYIFLALLCLAMMIVTSVSFMLNADTRKVGLWMLLTIAVIFIIGLLEEDGVRHTKAYFIVILYPAFKMFAAFDEYLQKSDDNVVELGDKKE